MRNFFLVVDLIILIIGLFFLFGWLYVDTPTESSINYPKEVIYDEEGVEFCESEGGEPNIEEYEVICYFCDDTFCDSYKVMNTIWGMRFIR